MLLIFGALASAAMPQAAADRGEFGRCVKQSGSMLEEARCYASEQERLEAEQAALLVKLTVRLKRGGPPSTDYTAAAAALAKAQAAWTVYREADCEIIDHVFGEGNAAGLAGGTCVIDHYATRNAVLRDLLEDYLSNE